MAKARYRTKDPLQAIAWRASESRSRGREEYTDEELAFLKAVDSYKRDYCRPFPACCEYLAVLKSLGYRKK